MLRATLRELLPLQDQPVDESGLQSVIDAVYSDSLADNWSRAVISGIKRFQDEVLANYTPFQCQENLEDCFSAMFDGSEVVPASLAEKFEAILKENPIEAASLLVPISNRQLGRLRGNGKVLRTIEIYFPVVDVPYTDLGLELARR